MTTPPPPNQPNQGNPFGLQAGGTPPQPNPQGYPQGQPAPGQPPQGQPAYGQPPAAGYAPIPGTPPYTPPTPPPPSSNLKKILIPIASVVAVIAIGAIVALIFRDKDSGTTVDSSPVGSCIQITEGSALSVETKAIDCSDTSDTVSWIIGAKLADSDACDDANYEGSITETGAAASNDVLCLIANYRVDSCYERSQIGLGLNLKMVPCTTSSGMMSTAFKVTQRLESKTVPHCWTPTLKTFAWDIKTDPATEMGICTQILGDYP